MGNLINLAFGNARVVPESMPLSKTEFQQYKTQCPQNGQTKVKNLATNAVRFLACV